MGSSPIAPTLPPVSKGTIMDTALIIKTLNYMNDNPDNWDQYSEALGFAAHICTQAGLETSGNYVFMMDLAPDVRERITDHFFDHNRDLIVNVWEAADALADPTNEEWNQLEHLFYPMSKDDFWWELGNRFPMIYREVFPPNGNHLP